MSCSTRRTRSLWRRCTTSGSARGFCAKKVIRERSIPFEVEARDPFYSQSNLAFLRKAVAALNAGEGVEHELIEDDT